MPHKVAGMTKPKGTASSTKAAPPPSSMSMRRLAPGRLPVVAQYGIELTAAPCAQAVQQRNHQQDTHHHRRGEDGAHGHLNRRLGYERDLPGPDQPQR